MFYVVCVYLLVCSAMKEACTWLSSNCQPKDILMKWSPLSLALGWVLLKHTTLSIVVHAVEVPVLCP